MNPERKQKDAVFISVHDRALLSTIKLPPNPNYMTLWFKKDKPNFWGFTVKSLEVEESGKLSKNHTWKITWVVSADDTKLLATAASRSFTDDIVDDTFQRLQGIVQDYQLKYKSKK